MSSLSWSLALHRRAKASADNFIEHGNFDTDETPVKWQQLYDRECETGLREFEAAAKLMAKTKVIYRNVAGAGMKESGVFQITVRPDSKEVNFYDFSIMCNTFVHRAGVRNFVLTYEQKGILEHELGNGFHAHMVVWRDKGRSDWKSKGEVLRYVKSTFGGVQKEPQVDLATTPDELIRNYYIDYKSDDGHKMLTKESDLMWRTLNNIKNIYRDEDVIISHPVLTSP